LENSWVRDGIPFADELGKRPNFKGDPMANRVVSLLALASVLAFAAGCGEKSPVGPSHTDDDDDSGHTSTTGNSGNTGNGTVTNPPATTPPTTTPPTTTAALAYTQDIKPILDSDCLSCHSSSRATAGYSVSTYAQVMRAVTAGNAQSTLIRATQSGGSMNRELSGDRAAKADTIRRWIVDNAAAENR
jgi:predicted small lipoprotein YifL